MRSRLFLWVGLGEARDLYTRGGEDFVSFMVEKVWEVKKVDNHGR